VTDRVPAVGELAVTGSAQLDRVIPCGRCDTVVAAIRDLFAAIDADDAERGADALEQLEQWTSTGWGKGIENA